MFAIDMWTFYVFEVLAETFYKNLSGRKHDFSPKLVRKQAKIRFFR
jgi:hypothetical protein